MNISVRPQGKGLRRTKTKCPYEIGSVQCLQKKRRMSDASRRVSQPLWDIYGCAETHLFARTNPLSSSSRQRTHQSFFYQKNLFRFTLPAPKPKLSLKSLISAPGLVPNLFSRKRSGRKVSGSSKKSRVNVSSQCLTPR